MPNTIDTQSSTDKTQLPALLLPELQALMSAWDEPSFRAKQVLDWRNKGVMNPDQMRNLPESLRQKLEQELLCNPLRLIKRQCSEDGTRKYLFALERESHRGKMVETVLIPEGERGTVCISSQVGCVLDCPFCHTGTQKFEANLTGGEIVAQILAIKHDLLNDPLPDDLHHTVTHIVYMGQGEPLANEQGLHQSLAMLLDDSGLKISQRRITVSTSGLVPQIERLGKAFPVNLAISLHAARNDLRDELVPINQKHPLEKLRQCLDQYTLGKQRHITLEYVMLAGINDTLQDLDALCSFVQKDRDRVNLITFNPYPGNPYEASSKDYMNKFSKHLISKGIRATVRRSRGQDIMAACGQLKSASKSSSTD